MNANLFRSAIHVAAVCGMYLATAMLIPALVDLYYHDNHWRVFAVSAFLIGGFSLLTATATRGAPLSFNKRFGFILVKLTEYNPKNKRIFAQGENCFVHFDANATHIL